MPRALKVFRTAIGFHDAYVAASSKKAALEAWGSDANLFARGLAEIVTDPELSKEPLARPGQVIKLSRGSAADHLAALGSTNTVVTTPRERGRPKTLPPRPDRAPLGRAEDALQGAESAAKEVAATFRAKEQELAQAHRVAERAAADGVRKARSARDVAKDRYENALHRWRG